MDTEPITMGPDELANDANAETNWTCSCLFTYDTCRPANEAGNVWKLQSTSAKYLNCEILRGSFRVANSC